MANKRRLTGYSGMRLDWPHVRAMESAVTHDFDELLRGLLTGLTEPYLIRGFRIKIPSAAINASSLQVEVADSAVLHPQATEAGTILHVPAGTADEILDSSNSRVVGAFQNGVANYIALDYVRKTDPDSVDQTAGWSPSQKLEYQRTSPIGKILDYKFVISTGGFSGMLPLYIVGISSTGAVTYITKGTTNLFRLGQGGSNPDPQYMFPWKNLSNTQAGNPDPRREWVNESSSLTTNPVTVTPGNPSDAFDYGDFSITNLKEWMDAVMSRFREVTGSPYWYLNGGSMTPAPNLTDLWWDSVGSVVTGTGNLSYNLILESTNPDIGAYQSVFVDGTVLPGDSYVKGVTSGTKATLTSFNNTQLIVNSLTKAGFVFDEVLHGRRLYRPSASYWSMKDHDDGDFRWARLYRETYATGATATVDSWSWDVKTKPITDITKVDTTYTVTFATAHDFAVRQIIQILGTGISEVDKGRFLVTATPTSTTLEFEVETSGSETSATGDVADGFAVVNVEATGHGFEVGQVVTLENLDVSGGFYPANGTYRITEVPDANNFKYYVSRIPTGTAALLPSPQAYVDNDKRHPYLPRFSVKTDAWDLTPGIAAPNRTWKVVGSEVAVVVPFHNFKVGQKILIWGLEFDGAGSDTPNGMHTVTSLGPAQGEVRFTPTVLPTGDPAQSSEAWAMYENHRHVMSVNDAVPDSYNVIDTISYVVSDMEMYYILGPNTLPQLAPASGAIEIDGVVCEAQVANPIRVTTITNDGAGNLTVTTVDPHGLSTTPGPLVFTIFGDTDDSIYIRTYEDVSITVSSPTIFIIQGTGLNITDSYTNPANEHDTFVKFADNPYAGPIAWDSDIIVKGIIGDKYFVIPQTALTDGKLIADKFNINGQTGTAYLQDGDVAYIELKRNKSVSSGAVYSTAGASALITGATVPVDEDGFPLVAGDFVKWEFESEARWMRIKGTPGVPLAGNSFEVVTDKNQAPTISQRPAAVGKLVYTKGIYDTVTVVPHWQVTDSADIWWLAVRRDNNSSQSKVYLKALELEAGEVRQLNDNEVSNHLIYTGAGNEAAVNPNYTVIDKTGAYQETEAVTVVDVDADTRMVTFYLAPDLGFQKEDLFSQGLTTWTVDQVLTSRTVIVKEDVTSMAVSTTDSLGVPTNTAGDSIYRRINYKINDADNLTLALRKEDRSLAEINTAISRMVYDESSFIQKMKFLVDHGSGASKVVKAGAYIYKGTVSNPTALAWVFHGSASVVEKIESFDVNMPGGHPSLLEGAAWDSGTTYSPGDIATYNDVDYQALTTHSNVIPTSSLGTDWNEVGYALVARQSGTWTNTDSIWQEGAYVGVKLSNPGDPEFPAPPIAGGTSGDGTELVLPPNRRTQVVGAGYVVYPTYLTYHASLDPIMAGEELLVIINDQPRQASLDYEETFGGPKGKIRLIRTSPPNTRLRARTLTAFGSALAAKPAGVDLQTAYNGGAIVVEIAGRPVDLSAGDAATGGSALDITGSVRIDGVYGSSVPGGLYGKVDKGFRIGDESNKPIEEWAARDYVKSHDSHPGSAWERFTTSHVTTGTSFKIAPGSEISLEENKAYRVKVRATARRSDGTFGVAGFTMEGVFYRKTGEDAAVAGSPITSIIGYEGDGINYAIAFGLEDSGSGSLDQVSAVLYGAGTVQWVLSIDVQAVGSAS